MEALRPTKILVTGASGFVGREICLALARAGIATRRAVRRPIVVPRECTGQETCFIEDLERSDWSAALDGVDVVVHAAAHVHVMNESEQEAGEFHRVNAVGTAKLAQAAARKAVRRFVFVSSAGVYGRSEINRPFSEDDTPRPHDPYTHSKWQAEIELQRLAAAERLEFSIIRPPLVYGTDAPGNFAALLTVITRGLPLPFGSLRATRSFIYVRNLADAIVTCATHPAATGEIFLVRDAEDISTTEFIRQCARALRRRAQLFSMPVAMLRLLGCLSGKSQQVETLLKPVVIDSSKIRTMLGWHPPYSMIEALRQTAHGYLSRDTRIANSPECA